MTFLMWVRSFSSISGSTFRVSSSVFVQRNSPILSLVLAWGGVFVVCGVLKRKWSVYSAFVRFSCVAWMRSVAVGDLGYCHMVDLVVPPLWRAVSVMRTSTPGLCLLMYP